LATIFLHLQLLKVLFAKYAFVGATISQKALYTNSNPRQNGGSEFAFHLVFKTIKIKDSEVGFPS
jgi:hypothetical protein